MDTRTVIDVRNLRDTKTAGSLARRIRIAIPLLALLVLTLPAREQAAVHQRIAALSSLPMVGQPTWFFPYAQQYSSASEPLLLAFAALLPMVQDTAKTSDTSSAKLPPKKIDTLLVPPGPFLNPRDSVAMRKAGAGARTANRPVPKGYEYSVDVDARNNIYRLREKFGEDDYSVSQTVSLDEYLDMRKDYLRKEISDSITGHYDLQKALTKDEISDIINQATNLTIPIPPNPLSGIFGKPEVSINVSGEVNVRGGWRWDSQELGTNSAFGQTQSGPIFNQDIKVNVNGRIGDKFKLGVDWSSRRQFEFDNKFRIGYEGYDDDIIKKVEVGNVQLNSGSTLIGGSQALFGVAADFQFGPVYLKTIASQKRGQRRFVQLKGGRLNQRFGIRAYEYAENHFFLDTTYKRVYRDYFAPAFPTIPASAQQTRVKEIEVWESVNQAQDVDGVTEGVAIDTLSDITLNQTYSAELKDLQQIQGSIERGRFQRLPESRFQYDANLGILTILNLRRDRTYGVAYRYEGPGTGPDDDRKFGTFADELRPDGDTVVLKLMYRQNLQPGFRVLWERQLKNIYPLNVNNVNLNDTEIGIWYFRNTNDSADVLQGSPDKIVTVLGVDRETNTSGDPNPDGVFDIQNRVFFNQQRGEIMFPSLEPFREGLRDYFNDIGNPALAEQFVFDAVYDTTKEVARLQTEKDRFIIGGEAVGSSGSRITLPNGFNLAPGSVVVSLDGRPLREGSDYTVEYYSGTITIRNQQALLPNANLSVEYEQNDIFNLSTRTLVGARADFDMKYLLRSRDITSNLGFTVMHYDQSLQVDRVRIGEEPVSNTMMGFDGQFNYKADWLTKAIDKLPLLDTKEPSSVSVRGEVAWMLPDPNKKKSDVPADDGASVVYIDDFEGAQRYIPLGLTATQWTHSSPPVDTTISNDNRIDTVLSDLRGRMYWFRYFIPRTPVREIWPNRATVTTNSNISDLHIRFDPDLRGIYNNNPEFRDTTDYTLGPRRDSIWGGMMRLLSSFNTNFDTDNIDFIEIMMKVEAPTQPETRMFIDLGQISEDVITNRQLNTEDGITGLTRNGIIDAGEDLGIDGLNNDQERVDYPAFADEEDPARDDYFFNFDSDAASHVPEDFLRYNNYEGNATISQTGQFPDTEILNRNNGESLMQDNSFFRYEVNLNTTDINANSQIVGGNPSEGWFLFRIPIRGPRETVGNPLFSNIQYVRVFWNGGVFQGRIAEWRLAGAQWQRFESNESGETDTTLNIAFVNREENSGAPDFYEMPPGVSAPRQLNNPDVNQDIRLNEQSLSLCAENLTVGEERTAVRFYRAFDMFYYKRLKYFIHGDGTMPDTLFPGATPPAYSYIRFGVDSLNYYEFRRPLLRGWRSVEIDLAELTAIKQLREAGTENDRQVFDAPGDPLGQFAIKGFPTLTRVQFIGFGIANPSGNLPNSLTTCMWVNELRLLDAEDRTDWGGFVNTQIKMADLADVSFAYNQTNPNFHRLEEQFGDRVERKNWNFNVSASLDRFFPKEWRGTAIPLTYSHSERKEDPQFVANSDINLEEAAIAAERQAIIDGVPAEQARAIGDATRRRSQTLVVEDSWALQGVRIGFPSKDWYVRDIFNNITLGYSYSQSFERSPVIAERFRWQWDLTAKYNVTIPPRYTVEPLTWAGGIPILGWYKDFKMSFLPANFNTGLTMSRGRTTEQSRFLDVPSPVIRRFTADRNLGFSWKLTEGGLLNTTAQYTMNASSTLVPFELDDDNQQRSGGDIFSQMVFGNGKLLDLGEDMRYRQNVTLNFKPAVPPIFGIDRYVTATGSFSTDYTWENQLQSDPAFQDIAKSATFNNNIRFGLTFRLKSLADNWFGEEDNQPRRRRGRRPARDTTDQNQDTKPEPSIADDFLGVFKTIFLDYDNVKLDFRQTNTSRNPGIIGGNGMTNFWARAPLFRDEENIFGPSAAYQMGLVSNPHGGFKVTGSSAFPFIAFETSVGKRPPNASLQDNFSQQTTLELRTSRPLWEGATLELNWSSDFGFNRNQTVTTDAEGIPSFSAVTISESYRRTYLSMPSFLLLGVFNNNIENVVDLYNERRNDIEGQGLEEVEENRQLAEALAESFRDGMEALAFLPDPIRRVLPRVNWFFRWEGLEKWGIFDGIARRIGVEHRYQSTYQENISVNDAGRQIESQSIELGFQPLIGLNFQFDQNRLGGTLTAKARYNTRTTYRVSTAARQTINKDVSNDFNLNVAYALRGFEFPLFGINLKNDVEFALDVQYRRTRRETFDLGDFEGENGDNLDGSTQIRIEPSARYTMSRRVRARAFFIYEANLTEGAARPGNTITEVGLDVSISIAGGR